MLLLVRSVKEINTVTLSSNHIWPINLCTDTPRFAPNTRHRGGTWICSRKVRDDARRAIALRSATGSGNPMGCGVPPVSVDPSVPTGVAESDALAPACAVSIIGAAACRWPDRGRSSSLTSPESRESAAPLPSPLDDVWLEPESSPDESS